MNPFKSIRKWTRKDFPDIDPKWVRRKIAEEETDRDLQKPVQQLLCDVHEESLAPVPSDAKPDEIVAFQLQRLIGAQKRMVSLQAVSAFQTSRTNALVFWLTFIIVFQTFFLIWLTVSPRQSPTAAQPPATNTSTNKP